MGWIPWKKRGAEKGAGYLETGNQWKTSSNFMGRQRVAGKACKRCTAGNLVSERDTKVYRRDAPVSMAGCGAMMCEERFVA
jgi:hypothetical protein